MVRYSLERYLTLTKKTAWRTDSLTDFNIILEAEGDRGAIHRDLQWDDVEEQFLVGGEEGDSITIVLRAVKQASGCIETGGITGEPQYVYIPGTPWASDVAWCEFYFPSLPPGAHPAVVILDTRDQYALDREISTGTGLSMSLSGKIDRLEIVPLKEQNVLTPLEETQGFKLLFDGRTTSGWIDYVQGDSGMSGAIDPLWKVEDGNLVNYGNGVKEIRTVEMYSDFEFRCEFRISTVGVSGIIFRATSDSSAGYQTGVEYAIIDNSDFSVGPLRDMGSAHEMYAVQNEAPFYPEASGKYNTVRIICHGNHVEHWFNGIKVLEFDINSQDWLDRKAEGVWADNDAYAQSPEGYIILQESEYWGGRAVIPDSERIRFHIGNLARLV
jgi:hypothetical protein